MSKDNNIRMFDQKVLTEYQEEYEKNKKIIKENADNVKILRRSQRKSKMLLSLIYLVRKYRANTVLKIQITLEIGKNITMLM